MAGMTPGTKLAIGLTAGALAVGGAGAAMAVTLSDIRDADENGTGSLPELIQPETIASNKASQTETQLVSHNMEGLNDLFANNPNAGLDELAKTIQAEGGLPTFRPGVNSSSSATPNLKPQAPAKPAAPKKAETRTTLTHNTQDEVLIGGMQGVAMSIFS